MNISLTEEMVMNPQYQDWRVFRIEYGFEGPIEGRIWTPPNIDVEALESAIQAVFDATEGG